MSEVFLFVLLSLASFRLQHFITSDIVPGEWVRGWFKTGYLFDFIRCHYCLGSWLTFATFFVADGLLNIRLPVLQALAGAAVVGLLGEWESK